MSDAQDSRVGSMFGPYHRGSGAGGGTDGDDGNGGSPGADGS